MGVEKKNKSMNFEGIHDSLDGVTRYGIQLKMSTEIPNVYALIRLLNWLAT